MSERDWKDRLHDSGYFPWKYYREAGRGTVEAMIPLFGLFAIVLVLGSQFFSDFPQWLEPVKAAVGLGFGWLSGMFAAQQVRKRHWDEAIDWYIKKYVD